MGALAQSQNTAYGSGALGSNYGTGNSAFGYYPLYSNTSTGYYNSALGAYALYENTSGSDNMAFGYNALRGNTTGSYNSAIGTGAIASAQTGNYNEALGWDALASNNSGGYNMAIGSQTLINNTSGNYNVAIGHNALGSNFIGSYNIAIGVNAGLNISSGPSNSKSYNIDIANAGTTTDAGTVRIGTSGNQTSFFVAGVDGVSVSEGIPVYINSSGQLGTVNSSIRYKEDVHDMGDASSAIFRLRPVTYHYKQAYADGSRPIDYGLIAEEVAKIYPDLVVFDSKGEIQTVQYQKLTPMLLNELQKQHQAVEQLEKTVKEQQQTIQVLKTQQAETIHLLEKRLTALEETQPSAVRLETELATK
ncbi:MAG TPA: tail fiber domain-containing protein [Acidobacteriaceae bacterium]|jgi:hypothetical protein|nr:tail fiber domain-containing protein [Acidobacteriaceae bacterium]